MESQSRKSGHPESLWCSDCSNTKAQCKCKPPYFTPEQLDNEWARLAKENPKGRIGRVEREFQDLIRQHEANLMILRAFAKQSLEKKED